MPILTNNSRSEALRMFNNSALALFAMIVTIGTSID
jgi:hypothetical protein